jgi:hypothetical protein
MASIGALNGLPASVSEMTDAGLQVVVTPLLDKIIFALAQKSGANSAGRPPGLLTDEQGICSIVG